MTERAEVIVVGGGVMGLSAAFHLAESGVDVLLLERDELGSGSTCRAAGGVRARVRTTEGLVDTSTVVVTAGAWSAAVGELAGVPLPVVPLRRQIIVTSDRPDLAADLPMTIDFGTSFYFHPEGPGLLI